MKPHAMDSIDPEIRKLLDHARILTAFGWLMMVPLVLFEIVWIASFFTDDAAGTSGDIPALPLFFTAAMFGTAAYYRHSAQIRALYLRLNQLEAMVRNTAGTEEQAG